MVDVVNVKLSGSNLGEVKMPESPRRVVYQGVECAAGGRKVEEARYRQVWCSIGENERVVKQITEMQCRGRCPFARSVVIRRLTHVRLPGPGHEGKSEIDAETTSLLYRIERDEVGVRRTSRRMARLR